MAHACTATALGRPRLDAGLGVCLGWCMSITPRPASLRLADPSAPAHERLYRMLRQQIMHGELAPGRSMTLRGLAAQYDMSMTPAREAVRRGRVPGPPPADSGGEGR